jgi:hypothetical protein
VTYLLDANTCIAWLRQTAAERGLSWAADADLLALALADGAASRVGPSPMKTSRTSRSAGFRFWSSVV